MLGQLRSDWDGGFDDIYQRRKNVGGDGIRESSCCVSDMIIQLRGPKTCWKVLLCLYS